MQLRNKSYLIIILVLILIVISLPQLHDNAWSHGSLMGKGYQEQELEGPNSGIVLKLEENYIELLVDHKSGKITLIMLDKKMKPISVPDNTTGLGYLGMTGSPVKWFNLKRGNRDQISYLYTVTGIENIRPFNAVV